MAKTIEHNYTIYPFKQRSLLCSGIKKNEIKKSTVSSITKDIRKWKFIVSCLKLRFCFFMIITEIDLEFLITISHYTLNHSPDSLKWSNNFVILILKKLRWCLVLFYCSNKLQSVE